MRALLLHIQRLRYTHLLEVRAVLTAMERAGAGPRQILPAIDRALQAIEAEDEARRQQQEAF